MTESIYSPRLPSTVIPRHYDLTLKPDLVGCTFDGDVIIGVQVNSPVTSVFLNSKELAYPEAIRFVHSSTESEVVSSEVKIIDADQVAEIVFPTQLSVGEGKLFIKYTGILNPNMVGFYASTYEKDGVRKTMATTQFEAVYARQALPCWDEPAIKATFTVHLIVSKELTAVSNMPLVKSEEMAEGTLVKRSFDKSPIMSTYLLAFIVGEFDFIETKTKAGVDVRVYTPVGKTDQGKFSLELAAKVLDFYNKYFEIEYPLPKLDQLAIPDFAMGAMENWGCVTYRSTALLVDSKLTSAAAKQWVALVVSHELAHQWFGNLVTMEWWTHLWLNEGFASWVEYLAVDELFPEWQIWTQFVYQDMRRALQLDSLQSSHPVEVPIKHATEVDEIFDSISYSKGASIIRMLVSFLGNETFRKGMVSYLNRFKYANASTEDLWASLSEYSKKDVKAFMDVWTKKTGFPVLVVENDVSSDGTIKVSQQRFLSDGSKSNDDTLWPIPVRIVSPSGSSAESTLFSTASGSIKLPADASSWFKLNSSQSGLYRVQYPKAVLSKLTDALAANALIDPLDRLGLQNDAFALSRAGIMSTVDALSLLKGYYSELNYTVWADISSNLGALSCLLKQSDLYEPFKKFGISMYSKIVQSLGWDAKPTDDHLTSMLRSLVVPRLALFGHQETISEAQARFKSFSASGYKEGIIPDLRSGVYAIVLANGGRSEFNELLELYRTSEFQEEKVRALGALAGITDPELLTEVLNFSISDEVRKQDVLYIFRGLNPHKHVLDIVWNFLQANWDKMYAMFGDTNMIGSIISSLGSFASKERADEIEEFFRTKRKPNVERSVDQALETIRSNAAWLSRDYSSLKSFLLSLS